DRLGRRGHVPEAGPIIDYVPSRIAVFGIARVIRYRDSLSRPRQHVQMLAGDGWPVQLCRDEPVGTDAGQPEAALGIRCHLQRYRDGVTREMLVLEPESAVPGRPFLVPGGFEPGAEVFPGCRVDLHHREGRAANRLP